jgi:hypothetical protein
MTEAEYLTTVKNSGGNPEPVTRETMTAQAWGPRRPSQGPTAREASTPMSSATGVGADRYLDIPEQHLGLRCRPGNTAATVKTAIFRGDCSCSILSTTAVNRGLFVLSPIHSNRYRGRRENRHESDEEWDRLTFPASLFVAAQDQRDAAANRSKLLPLKTRGTRRKSARTPGLSTC